MSYSVKKVLDSILEMLLAKLSAEGFVEGGIHTLIRSTPESVFAFNFQANKYNTKVEGKFTIELKLWYPELAAELGEKDANVRKTGGMHLTERLAMLAPAPPGSRHERADRWWEISQSTDPHEIATEIYSLWEQYGRPWLAQNETLSLALPRILERGSGYYAVTAVYVTGDFAGARAIVQKRWRGSNPGHAERIEWAWKRNLFDLVELRAALSDENHQTRFAAVDILWKIVRFDPHILSMAADLVSNLTNDPDHAVARHARELRESLYIRDGELRIIPRDVPTLEKLPKEAAIAFAVRCARRVEGNISKYWPGIKAEHRNEISNSLEMIKEIAAGKRPRSDGKIAYKQLEPVRRAAERAAEKSEEVKLAESAIESAYFAALAVTGGAASAEVAARMALHAVPESQALELRKEIWEDFDRLERSPLTEFKIN